MISCIPSADQRRTPSIQIFKYTDDSKNENADTESDKANDELEIVVQRIYTQEEDSLERLSNTLLQRVYRALTCSQSLYDERSVDVKTSKSVAELPMAWSSEVRTSS